MSIKSFASLYSDWVGREVQIITIVINVRRIVGKYLMWCGVAEFAIMIAVQNVEGIKSYLSLYAHT